PLASRTVRAHGRARRPARSAQPRRHVGAVRAARVGGASRRVPRRALRARRGTRARRRGEPDARRRDAETATVARAPGGVPGGGRTDRRSSSRLRRLGGDSLLSMRRPSRIAVVFATLLACTAVFAAEPRIAIVVNPGRSEPITLDDIERIYLARRRFWD